MVQHGRHELTPSRFVQAESAILQAPRERYDTANAVMDALIRRLTQ
jgi:hypothetical protein